MIHGAGVPIAVAAGLDETTFGTDATAIADAIVGADQGQGVVVLMDLGSAVLSAELALDLVGDDIRDRVVLCPAPLVEGLVVAAVTAAAGADAQRVCDEACKALAAKIGQLRQRGPASAAQSSRGTEFFTGVFALATPHGLHARPAARLVGEIARHDLRAELRNRTQDSAWVPADSLTAVMTLDGRHGEPARSRSRELREQRLVPDGRVVAAQLAHPAITSPSSATSRSRSALVWISVTQ